MESLSKSSLESSALCDSEDTLLSDIQTQETSMCKRCKSKRRALPWLISLLSTFSLIASISFPRRDSTPSSLSFWKISEFETAKKELPPVMRQRRFDAVLKYNESHQLYRPINNPPYVGDPSPEIDKAWDDLRGSVYVYVAPEEVNLFPDADLWLDPETGLHKAHLTVMHDLHCLDLIRKSRHLDHYPELKDYTLQAHVEHCIDSLRQSIMCTGDMTFMPMVYSENRNWPMPIFGTVHTCRDYDSLKAWSKNRDASHEDLRFKNAERYRKTGKFQP